MFNYGTSVLFSHLAVMSTVAGNQVVGMAHWCQPQVYPRALPT